jgi:hypothetical protein
MAIDVTCASCKTRFQVSDKFAGKQGPCPKCKKIITVPTKKDEVVIHAPEGSGPKDSKGQLVLKPLTRKETRLTQVNIGIIVGSVILILLMSLVLRITYAKALQPPASAAAGAKGGKPKTKVETPPGTDKTDKKTAGKKDDKAENIGITVPFPLQVILALGSILLAPAIAFAGYTFLRNDELEPYRGQALWMRLAIFALAYPAMWGIYWAVFAYLGVNPPLIALAMIIPLLILGGAFIAHVTLDIEYGTALLHCCMYLSATVLLRLIIGLPPHWSVWGT